MAFYIALASAYKYPAWWANGYLSQADAWLNAGWKAEEIKLGELKS